MYGVTPCHSMACCSATCQLCKYERGARSTMTALAESEMIGSAPVACDINIAADPISNSQSDRCPAGRCTGFMLVSCLIVRPGRAGGLAGLVNLRKGSVERHLWHPSAGLQSRTCLQSHYRILADCFEVVSCHGHSSLQSRPSVVVACTTHRFNRRVFSVSSESCTLNHCDDNPPR